jgi:hypothetical protein
MRKFGLRWNEYGYINYYFPRHTLDQKPLNSRAVAPIIVMIGIYVALVDCQAIKSQEGRC